MSRYKVTEKSRATLDSEYPHNPDDFNLSMLEYLEAEWSSGWEAISISSYNDTNTWTFVFKANGQP